MRCTNVSQLQAGVAKCVGESGLGLKSVPPCGSVEGLVAELLQK